jgi:class 3 adenylate cyclase
MEDALASARTAAQQRVWDEAVRGFTEADRDGGLAPADLELLAEAAWWAGQPDDAVDALERAYAAYDALGENVAAARVALWLVNRAFEQSSFSALQGWHARAERLLEGEPESAEHAWVAFWRMALAFFVEHDVEAAIAHADRATEIGRRHGDRDVETIARSMKGHILIKTGAWREGLALIDEAAAVATSGELTPKFACDIYCNTIASCRDLGDFRRALEWTDRATRWMRRQSVDGYVGICRVHKAELHRLRGSWSQAEQEARQACDELERYNLMIAIGFAHYEVGEVRLRMGDLDAAEEEFLHAHETGWDPYPGLALLMLARGEADEAANAIARALSGGGEGPTDGGREHALERARLLPAQVEIALARGDVATAEAATDEMEALAEAHDSPAWTADAEHCRGALLAHQGEHGAAIDHLTRAWKLWHEVELPYESARARVLLARSYQAIGDGSAARLELRAARSTFERLGAVPDVRRVDELLGADGRGARRHRESVHRTFMFTDIVTSTDLVGVIGDEAWGEVLRWHDGALRRAFARHHGEEVSHTGDGFFVAFDDAADAVECAVDIQRSLVAHRREHGFAPWVRIGLHTAEAIRAGADYRGHGVHAAARVGALAGREEIVASPATLAAAGSVRYPLAAPRPVTLTGIADEVEVVTIDWR